MSVSYNVVLLEIEIWIELVQLNQNHEFAQHIKRLEYFLSHKLQTESKKLTFQQSLLTKWYQIVVAEIWWRHVILKLESSWHHELKNLASF